MSTSIIHWLDHRRICRFSTYRDTWMLPFTLQDYQPERILERIAIRRLVRIWQVLHRFSPGHQFSRENRRQCLRRLVSCSAFPQRHAYRFLPVSRHVEPTWVLLLQYRQQPGYPEVEQRNRDRSRQYQRFLAIAAGNRANGNSASSTMSWLVHGMHARPYLQFTPCPKKTLKN